MLKSIVTKNAISFVFDRENRIIEDAYQNNANRICYFSIAKKNKNEG